ncbi:hypothetical protein Moror_17710 [Moniliophthora roreri MCA 2997]|uniref:Uncharacterized protein n=1 Tax=Moniliophthora roreri (strain MCA 2997) TaxID=1381753 RepID=V2Z0A0_MONRO|nr:hypothetical protein Moror_17710 [Moniliophthora roreri MCA 2997]
MGFLGYFSATPQTQVEAESVAAGVTKDDTKPDEGAEPVDDTPSISPSNPPADTEFSQSAPIEVPLPLSPVTSEPNESLTKPRGRRFSFKTFSFASHHDEHKHTLSLVEEHQKKEKAHAALSKRLAKPMSRSDRRAQESALIVRTLIVGPSKASPSLTAVTAKPQMSKLKSQLLKPKSANKVISHLRSLPTIDEEHPDAPKSKGAVPIHAVCLEHTDAEEHNLHFAKLSSSSDEQTSSSSFGITQLATAPIDKLAELFSEMCVVEFISTSDFGLGQPGDGKGLLAGAVPTAETVINGIQQITPQLMALGYATGQAIYPDHAGVYPPTDRMSVITYWWGLEILLPPPSIVYLNSVHSISGTVVNFLSALSMINNGVREILPFVRYMAQFIDFEFNNIKGQDKGKGVICAATWVMPAALVPRPWDFSPPPPVPTPAPTPALAPPTNGSEQPEAGKSQPQGVVEKPAAGDSTPATQPGITPTPVASAPVQPPIEEKPSAKAPADLPTALPVPISISVPMTPVS